MLILPQVAIQTPTKPPVTPVYMNLIKPVEQPRFPSPSPEHIKESIQVVDQERAAEAAEAARLAAVEAARIAQEANAVQMQQDVVYQVRQASGTLEGSLGYISPLNNCVTLAIQFGKNQPGDPITWAVSSHTPAIGDAVLFYFNHVGIVTGIWSNGDIEIAQANFSGSQTRYTQSEVRGYF